jgi:uncharacterized membrane protein YhdT
MTLTPGFVVVIEWLIIGDLPGNALGMLGLGCWCSAAMC